MPYLGKPQSTNNPEIIRTTALLRIVGRRLGVETRFQFGQMIDNELAKRGYASSTQSGHWYGYIGGIRSLSQSRDRLLDSLSVIYSDANDLYLNGPSDLWTALWGGIDRLWALCRTQYSNLGPFIDDEAWGTSDKTHNRSFAETLRVFEAELLFAEAYREPLTIRHLTEAISLYRLHRHLDEVTHIPLDCVSAYRCIWMCLEDISIWSVLDELGVFNSVKNLLIAMETERLEISARYRTAIGIDQHLIYLFAEDPFSWFPTDARWDTVQPAEVI